MFRKVGLLIVLGLMLSGCSLTSSNNVAPTTQPRLESRLLTLRDLPSGWTMHAMPQVGSDLCGAPPLSSSLVDQSGVAVSFQRNDGEILLVEYLTRTSKPVDAMERAISQVASPSSCSESSNGRVTRKSVNVGIIEVPTVGDWSVATKNQIFSNGKRSELGYMLVRVKGFFLAVAYENAGSLDMSRLENFANVALSKVRN